MTLSDIKNYVYRRTASNSTAFPAADMLIAVNNAYEHANKLIRTWIHTYHPTLWSSGDLSTGTAEPKFDSLFHEIIPLRIAAQRAADKDLPNRDELAVELAAMERELMLFFGSRNYKECSITIAAPGVITLDNHGLRAGDKVLLFTSSALPTGLSAETWYYVVSANLGDHTFSVSATRDGTAITTTGSQTGTHFVSAQRVGRLQPSRKDSNK